MAPFIIRDEAGRKRAIDFLSRLNLAKPWQMTVGPLRKKRSLEQNNLYWLWVHQVALATGNSDDDVHEAAKQMFLPKHFVTIGSETVEVRKTTTKLSTAEMTDYLNRFSAWAESEMGICLPHPDDLGRDAA